MICIFALCERLSYYMIRIDMKRENQIFAIKKIILPLAVTLVILFLLEGCSSSEPKKDEIILLKEADDAISRGNFDEAVSILQKAIALNSKESKAYLKLGLLYEKILLNPQEAKKYYKIFLDIETDETLKNQVNKWLAAIEQSDTPFQISDSEETTGLVRLIIQQNRIEQDAQIAKIKDRYEREIADLKSKLDSMTKEGEEQESVEAGFIKESGDPSIEELKKRIKELESELAIARENDSTHIERYASARKSLDEEKAKYTELENKFFELERNYRIALARVNELTGEKVTDDKLPEAEKELSEARKRINDLQQQLVKSKNELAIAENNLRILMDENAKLKAEKSSISSAGKSGSSGTSQPVSKTKTDVPGVKEITATNIIYVVQQGDTLSRISEKFYGDKRKWNYIYNSNRDLLKNQNDIKVGDTIKVPILK